MRCLHRRPVGYREVRRARRRPALLRLRRQRRLPVLRLRPVQAPSTPLPSAPSDRTLPLPRTWGATRTLNRSLAPILPDLIGPSPTPPHSPDALVLCGVPVWQRVRGTTGWATISAASKLRPSARQAARTAHAAGSARMRRSVSARVALLGLEELGAALKQLTPVTGLAQDPCELVPVVGLTDQRRGDERGDVAHRSQSQRTPQTTVARAGPVSLSATARSVAFSSRYAQARGGSTDSRDSASSSETA